MGLNILSLFVENADEIKQTKEKENNSSINEGKKEIVNSTNNETVTNNTSTVTNTTINTNTDDIKNILDKLCKHLESCDLPTPDYMDLKKAANSESMQVIPDESVRFQAAFATLKSMYPQFTKDIVINSIDSYINELNKQKDIAFNQIETKRKSQVEDKSTVIKEKENQIAKLQDEIVKLSTEVNIMKVEVTNADNECNKNKSDFNTAVTTIIDKLNIDKKSLTEKLIG